MAIEITRPVTLEECVDIKIKGIPALMITDDTSKINYIGILTSCEYGCGYVTRDQYDYDKTVMLTKLFDPELIKRIIKTKKKYGDGVSYSFVSVRSKFYIDEYDGTEGIQFEDKMKFIFPEDVITASSTFTPFIEDGKIAIIYNDGYGLAWNEKYYNQDMNEYYKNMFDSKLVKILMDNYIDKDDMRKNQFCNNCRNGYNCYDRICYDVKQKIAKKNKLILLYRNSKVTDSDRIMRPWRSLSFKMIPYNKKFFIKEYDGSEKIMFEEDFDFIQILPEDITLYDEKEVVKEVVKEDE
jgi:hypothetical protein